MPKRTDRTKPMDHEMRQIEALKDLEPIATPPKWKPFSDALIDLAVAALSAARVLEDGRRPGDRRMAALIKQAEALPGMMPPRKRTGGDDSGEDE
jgi:hypothetical protein